MDEPDGFSQGDDGQSSKAWHNQPSELPWQVKERMVSNGRTIGAPPRRTIEHPIMPTEWPRMHKERPLARPEPPEPIVCVPVEVGGAATDPLPTNPSTDPPSYNVGDTVTRFAFGVSGTPPFEYRWYLNGVLVTTNETHTFTITLGMVQNIDPVTLIGSILSYVEVFNDCGEAQTSELGGIFVQT